jgi:hypothetical protein
LGTVYEGFEKIFILGVDTLSIIHILGHMKGKAERLWLIMMR